MYVGLVANLNKLSANIEKCSCVAMLRKGKVTSLSRFKGPTLFLTMLLFVLSQNARCDTSHVEQIELLDWIGHEGVEDPSWSDQRIFSAIQQGLSHENSDVVNATIGAMAWIAAYADLKLEDRRSTKKVVRNIGKLSGIKEYLINRWNEEYRDNSNPWIGSEQTKFVELRNSKTVWKAEWAWLTIPAILATFFRQDSEILDVLWQSHNTRHPELLLSLLNVAQMETEKANEFRVQILFDPNAPAIATAIAIDSLGRFHSDEGLAALISRLKRDDTRPEITSMLLTSIGSYGDKIKPYQSMLDQMTRELGLSTPENREVESPDDELLAYLMFMVKNGYEDE